MEKSGFSFTRFGLFAGLAAVVAVLLSSCAPDRTVPPCPTVRVDNLTANVTQFKDGPGRDVGDIVYQAEVVTYGGSCTQDEKEVRVDLDVDFAMATGAAAPKGDLPLYYFVAIPQLLPDPNGKKIFEIHRTSPGGASKATYWTEHAYLNLPITPERPAASYDIYVGFQLSDEQLAFNRTRIR